MRTREDLHHGTLMLDGRRVSYLWADGNHGRPTLVFLHGSGMSARYWSALCGSRDRITPPAWSRDLHTTIAGSDLQIVDEAGHMLLIEAPEVVNSAIAAFAGSNARHQTRSHAAPRAAVLPWWRRVLWQLSALVRRD